MTNPPPAEIAAMVTTALERYRTHPDWDDIRQEAIVAAWTALNDGKGSGVAASTVVYKRARWAAAEYLRSSRSLSYRRYQPDWEPPVSLNEEIVSAPDPAADFATIDDDLHIRALVKVPVRYRWLFLRHYIDGVKQCELAKEEGVGPARIGQIIEHVRQVYRQEFGVEKKPSAACWQCGAALSGRTAEQRYCSPRCKWRAQDRRRGHRPWPKREAVG